MKLVYTDEAIADLKRLREFIAVHNPSAAGKIAAELVGKIELLPDFPKLGTPVEMAPVPDSVRDMVFGKYVVRYSVHVSAIIILRVWHEPGVRPQEMQPMPAIETLQNLASEIVRAQNNCSQLNTFSSLGRTLSMHEAYEVSWLVHEERLNSGWIPVGRKIGFTNSDMWSLFGVTQPVWSFVYDRTYEEIEPTFDYQLAALVQPKIEPEIVLCMRAVPSIGASENDVLDCVEWVAHGIEMVQCHYPNWQFTATDAVCDSSLHGKLFVGKKRFIQPNHAKLGALLKECAVGLYRDEELVEVGYGRNALGSPLLAITSLMEAIQREGSRYPIMPGEIITTGTITKAYSVRVGERWQTEFKQDEFPGLTIDFV